MKLKLSFMVALITIVTFIGVGSIAAEPEVTATQAETTEQNGDASEDTSDEDASEPQVTPSGDVFIPTEEISEDFAVSFPVDI